MSVQPFSILVIDDEPTNLQAVADYLHKDYKVFMTVDPERTFEIIQKQLPDLILLDISMPK